MARQQGTAPLALLLLFLSTLVSFYTLTSRFRSQALDLLLHLYPSRRVLRRPLPPRLNRLRLPLPLGRRTGGVRRKSLLLPGEERRMHLHSQALRILMIPFLSLRPCSTL